MPTSCAQSCAAGCGLPLLNRLHAGRQLIPVPKPYGVPQRMAGRMEVRPTIGVEVDSDARKARLAGIPRHVRPAHFGPVDLDDPDLGTRAATRDDRQVEVP